MLKSGQFGVLGVYVGCDCEMGVSEIEIDRLES